MATASKAAALQTALLSVRSLRRRKLGHISPTNFPHLELDKWGRKNTNSNGNGMPSNLLAGGGGGRRPAPRASLVFGGEGRNSLRRGNNVTLNNGCSNTSSTNGIRINGRGNSKTAENGNRINGKRLHKSRRYINGSSQQLQAVINGGSSQQQNANSNQSTTSSSKKDRQTKDKSDLIVVLDMDECLIHSQFLSDVDKYRQAEERPSATSTTTDISTSQSTFEPGGGQHSPSDSLFLNACDSFRITLPDGDLVNVNKRPNLDLFLREITNKFETYIFTAAMEVSYMRLYYSRDCA